MSYGYSPWFEAGMAGFKVLGDHSEHLYTIRMHAPDKFGAIRIELLDADNKLISSELMSLALGELGEV